MLFWIFNPRGNTLITGSYTVKTYYIQNIQRFITISLISPNYLNLNVRFFLETDEIQYLVCDYMYKGFCLIHTDKFAIIYVLLKSTAVT